MSFVTGFTKPAGASWHPVRAGSIAMMELRKVVISVVSAVGFVLPTLSSAQEMAHRGAHPAAGQEDPYLVARSVGGGNCCHGTDCTPWHGGEPVPAVRDGIKGVTIGRWFFREDQRIDPMTLNPRVRGEASICIGETANAGGPIESPRCYYYPSGS
jgi:hypothetical protein